MYNRGVFYIVMYDQLQVTLKSENEGICLQTLDDSGQDHIKVYLLMERGTGYWLGY